MSPNYKNILFNIISLVAFLNAVLLILSIFVLLNTGDSVLKGKIYPVEPFESDFILNDTKEVTLVFHAINSERTELLNITIMNSDREIVFSKLNRFSISRSSDDPPDTVKSAYSTGAIFTPKTSGKYYIPHSRGFNLRLGFF